LTDTRNGSSYLGDTQREVKQMNGMLHHHDLYREAAERRDNDVEAWARSRSLGDIARGNVARGNVARSARSTVAEHPRAARWVGVTLPVATILAAIAILI
jgi:hypothetical protein